MERQRQIEADRNKKALDRALAPPYIKVNISFVDEYHALFLSQILSFFRNSTLILVLTHYVNFIYQQPELRKQEVKRVVTTKRRRKKAKVVGGVVQRRDSSTTSVPVPFGSY